MGLDNFSAGQLTQKLIGTQKLCTSDIYFNPKRKGKNIQAKP